MGVIKADISSVDYSSNECSAIIPRINQPTHKKYLAKYIQM